MTERFRSNATVNATVTALSPALSPMGSPVGSSAGGATPLFRMNDADVFEAFSTVASMLWSEREVLEKLLFKLVEEQLIVSSGSTRWLHKADDELRAAVEEMRAGEIVRSAEVDTLVRRLGLPVETTLAQLAEFAPEPWGTVLLEHREALRQLVLEVESVTAENRRLLQAGAQATRDILDHLSTSVATYDARGEAVHRSRGGSFLDHRA